MGRVDEKLAVVTGGAVGIGRSACLLLAREGASVAVTDVQDEAGRKLGGEIEAAGGVAGYWHMDVGSEAEVATVFEEVIGAFGEIGILVNNAGISGASKPTHEISEEEWDAVQRVNVKGGLPVHEARDSLHETSEWGQHHQPVVHLRPRGGGGRAALPTPPRGPCG